MSESQTMLLAYDGTDEAAHAMEYAAKLLRPTTVEIITAWEPSARQAARSVSRVGVQMVGSSDDPAADPAYEEAQRVCNEGVNFAESLGLSGRGHLVESATTIYEAIAESAAELDADVIVTGTRAVSGVRSLWNTSTAEHLVRHAGRPVFVVPPLDTDA